MIHLIFLTIGIIVGFLSGIFGIGGGIIVFPTIYFCLTKILLVNQSLSLCIAAATSLVIIIPTLSIAVIAHQKSRHIKWQIVKLMLPGIITGVLIATIWLNQIFSPNIIKIIFTLSSLLIALQIFLQRRLSQDKPRTPSIWLTILAGGIIGAASSLLGIAGGEYSASFLSWYNMKIKKVAGTTAAIGLMISIFGSIGFLISSQNEVVPIHLPFLVGYVYLPAVMQICLTSLIMASIGEKFSHHLKASKMRRYFVFLIAATGLIMPFI